MGGRHAHITPCSTARGRTRSGRDRRRRHTPHTPHLRHPRRSSRPCSSPGRRGRPRSPRRRGRPHRHKRPRGRRRREACSGGHASPWQTTRRAGSGSAAVRRARSSASAIRARRSAFDHVQGHSSTGSASCRARRPAPSARAVCVGVSVQGASTADVPGIVSVMSALPSPSPSSATTGGTAACAEAHRSRSASASRSGGEPTGCHFTCRGACVPTAGRRNVRPPSPLRHTASARSPPGSAATSPGVSTFVGTCARSLGIRTPLTSLSRSDGRGARRRGPRRGVRSRRPSATP